MELKGEYCLRLITLATNKTTTTTSPVLLGINCSPSRRGRSAGNTATDDRDLMRIKKKITKSIRRMLCQEGKRWRRLSPPLPPLPPPPRQHTVYKWARDAFFFFILHFPRVCAISVEVLAGLAFPPSSPPLTPPSSPPPSSLPPPSQRRDGGSRDQSKYL